jgi:RNA polymerase sigma-70 factor, ECF subfamily
MSAQPDSPPPRCRPEVAGLLALLLLTESRRRARFAADGSLVLLRDQDRTRWDRAMIDEGQMIVRACLRRNQPGPYQIQAGICCALGVHPSSVYGRDYDVQEAS